MIPANIHYFPLESTFLLALAVLALLVVALVELQLLKHAYERMGVPPRFVLGILLLSLAGSAINVPVLELPPEKMVSDRVIEYYGVRYVVPVIEERAGTVIAINAGGAIIPLCLSIYLIVRNRLYWQSLLAVAIVATGVHILAHPVRGVGITVPVFVPPLIAAGVAMAIAWRQAPPLAYICGSMGTLIGADILNLDKIEGLGAPVASIGGAGTFDAVFLTGILAVLLCSLAGTPHPAKTARKESESGP